MPETQRLSDVLREIAASPPDDPLVSAAITASVRTLNAGVTQDTHARFNPETRRKHHARLFAALVAMADWMDAVERESTLEELLTSLGEDSDDA